MFQPTWSHPHYRIVHPSYAAWSKRWAIILPSGYGILVGIFLVVTLTGDGDEIWTLLPVIGAISIFPLLWVRAWKNKVEEFWVDWRLKTHPQPEI
jgi:hypothetical protein